MNNKANQAIGLDIGHSSVKASAISVTGTPVKLIIPSLVCPAFPISDEAEARRAALDTVKIGERSFFVGETAKVQGGPSVTTGLSEDWIDTPEHAALLVGAINRLKGSGVAVDGANIVLGLPTHLVNRQKDRLKEITGRHVSANTIRVIPQPMGPYQTLILESNGLPSSAHTPTSESWGVVEIGYYTTDIMLIQNGRWVEKASGVCSGVRVAAEHLVRLLAERGITSDMNECEEALRTRSIRNFGRLDVSSEADKSITMLVTEVIDRASQYMEPYARKLDGVIVAGGGAPLVYPHLRAKWPHALLLDSPRFAVAEGMRRLALALSYVRNLS